MAVSDINLLPQTAGIQLQSSPYAPPAPLDFSQLSNLQQIENQQRRMEMEGRRLEMQERQMEQALIDRQAALERQNMLDRLTYVDKITNLPIPLKRAQRAAELQQSLGIEELFDPNRTDISVMDAARTSFEYVSHPEVRMWTQEQAALDHMAKLMEKHPNRSIYLKRESEWQNDDTGTVPFPTIADLDYVDYEGRFDKLFKEFREGAKSPQELEDFIEAYYRRPEIARQVEWDLGPGGLNRLIEGKKAMWGKFDVDLGRPANRRVSTGNYSVSNLPGFNVLTPEQRKNIGDRMGIGGEKFTEAYIDALNSQRNPDSEESVQAYNSVAATLLSNISGGKDGLLDRTEIFVGGDRSNSIEINASEEVGSVGKGRTAKLSWLGGQAMNRLDLGGSNLNEIFEEYKLERGTSAGDKNNVYLTGRVSPELLDSIIDGISWGGNRSTRKTRDSFRKEAEGGLIVNIPLGSGDRLRTSTTQESPQTIGANTTNVTPSGGSYAAIPELAPWYSVVIDNFESSPELIDLGDGTTTLVGYNQLYKNGVPLQNYLNGLGEKSLEGLINNNQGLAKYLQLQNMGVRNPIENMTVKEVQDLQKVQVEATKGDPDIKGNAEGGNKGTSAMTRIQIIQKTLEGLLEQIENPDSEFHIEGFDRENNLFTQGLQDHLFLMLLERRGLSKFLEDPSTLDTFANNLAEEWEGVGKLKNNDERWNQFKDELMAMRDEMLSSNQQEAQVTPPPTQEQSGESTDFNYYGFNFGGSTPAPVPGRGQILQ